MSIHIQDAKCGCWKWFTILHRSGFTYGYNSHVTVYDDDEQVWNIKKTLNEITAIRDRAIGLRKSDIRMFYSKNS